MSGAVDIPKGWEAIQWDLDSLEKWAYVNLMRLNRDKWRALHLGLDDLWRSFPNHTSLWFYDFCDLVDTWSCKSTTEKVLDAKSRAKEEDAK